MKTLHEKTSRQSDELSGEWGGSRNGALALPYLLSYLRMLLTTIGVVSNVTQTHRRASEFFLRLDVNFVQCRGTNI